ncbi:MAG: Uma2 family endonuclease [Polyangiaceae bacterium]|nr:Uma2 family endonuclease [Polyangiaceae bacterium]
MDPKSSAGPMVLAPAAHGGVESRSIPRADRRPTSPFPPVDEHLVQPEAEARYEMIRGRKVSAMVALLPHAKAQGRLAFLTAPHVRPGYSMSTELLTRASEKSDFGTDVCVCRDGTDPATGSRYLEEISFEVVNEQRLRDVTDKAEDLIHRGVRRVFAIFVKTNQVAEWSKDEGKFVPLNEDGVIEDKLFIRPIAVRALIDFAEGENEVARALITKGNAEIVKLKEDAHKKGLDEGHKKGVHDTFCRLLRLRFGNVPDAVQQRIDVASIEELERWTERLFVATSLDDVFISSTQ